MANDWDGLDEDLNGQQSFEEDEGVEYVGVLEDEDEDASVLEPVRAPRRPVQRVAPVQTVQNGAAGPAMRNGAGAPRVVGGANGKKEPLVYYPTETGSQVALNAEALENLRKSKLQDVGGKAAYRIQPGTYVMVVPGRDPRRMPMQGVGTDDFDTLLGQMARTGSALPQQPSTRSSQRQSGVGTADAAGIMSSIGDILDPLARLGIGLATTITGSQQAERQAALDRRRLELEAEAATAARATAAEAATRAHRERMAQIRQQQAELAELQRTEDAAARAAASREPIMATTGGGTSPVVWVLLALVGVGGIGGLIWYLSSKKKEKEE